MALVSEFLGQLTLSYGGEVEPKFPTVVPSCRIFQLLSLGFLCVSCSKKQDVPLQSEDFPPLCFSRADTKKQRLSEAADSQRIISEAQSLTCRGVDEQTIIDILTRRSYEQRREIAFIYERLAKKDLIAALKGALSGSLESLMLGLMKSTAQYDASELKASMKGLGTDEETLIEIVCSRNNEELLEIKKVYRETFKKELEKDIAGDTSGDFAKLLLALVQTKRDEPSNVVDYQMIDDDARSLYEAGVKRKGTDVATWIAIMAQRSVPHLQKVFERYKSYSPYDMKESIRKESKGAKEKVVTRIMVSRCEVDLMKIRTQFKKQHRRSLYQTIAEHTKGDYQKALLSLCGGDD
eukprot:superscaffoldBa00003316_g16645